MAFIAEDLALAVDTIGGGNIRIHFYDTDDTEATVTATDYFTSAERRGMRLGDLLVVRSNGTSFLANVDAISGAGHATIGVDRNMIVEYETATALAAASVPPIVNAVRTQGYAATGDRGGGLYKRVSTPVSPQLYHVQSVGGAWWELVDSPSDLGVVTDLQAAIVAPSRTSLSLAGYYSTGDGGGARYKRAASEPSHAGKAQSLDGAWWELAEVGPSVKMFGARGDGRSVTALVSITSGAAILTAAGAAFTAADVGKMIVVPGAGAAGGILSTTILSYTSPTQITLAANAGTTVTTTSKVIQYSTDDTSVLNAIIAAINAGYFSDVWVPKGFYGCTTLNAITGYTNWLGAGPQSSVLQTFSPTGDIFTLSGTSQVFRNIGITSVVTRTSGVSLKMNGNLNLAENFDITYPYRGVWNTGVLNRLAFGNINMITSRNIAAGSGGVYNTGTILSCFDVAMGSGTHTPADMAAFGFKADVGEVDLTQCFVFLTDVGFDIAPGAGQTVLGINLKGCWFDSTLTAGLRATPAHSTALLQLIWASDCWFGPGFGSGASYGVILDNTVNASMTKVWLNNNYHISYNNGAGVGLYVVGGSNKIQMHVANSMFGDNGQAFSSGVLFVGATTSWTLTGSSMAYNTVGITISAGCDDYIITGCRIQNNSGAISDSSTPTNGLIVNNIGYEQPWKSYTPTIASSSGALSAATATGKYKVEGKSVHFTAAGSVTNVGTGSVAVELSLPFAANALTIVAGRERAFGAQLQGDIQPAASVVSITKYDNTFPAANGTQMVVSGTYERV